MNGPDRRWAVLRAAPYELWPLLFVLSGIVLFNREFTHLGFRQLYVTEAVTGILLLASLAAAALRRPDARDLWYWLASGRFRLLHLLLIYAALRLALDLGHGVLALRHAMIVVYSVFVALFVVSLRPVPVFRTVLRYLLGLSAAFNSAKLLFYWAQGAGMEGESFRVFHNEVDVICASLGLIAVIALPGEFGRLGGVALCAANLLILLLSVKRTAFLGLAAAVAALLLLRPSREVWRSVARVALLAVLCAAVIGVVVWFAAPERFASVAHALAGKLHFVGEDTASWRLSAWRLAFRRWLEAPLFGIGYGVPVLRTALHFAPTSDPHNSYLAFLARHGLVGFALLCATLGQTGARYLERLRAGGRDETETRNLVLFCFLAYVYMLTFAFFNVVLENQYEGVFFWLGFAGLYVVEGSEIATTAAGRPGPALAAIHGATLASLAVYAALVLSPWNRPVAFELYSAERGAQLPKPNASAGDPLPRVESLPRGLRIASIAGAGGPSRVDWTLPDWAFQGSHRNEEWAFVLDAAEPLSAPAVLTVSGRVGVFGWAPLAPGQRRTEIPFRTLGWEDGSRAQWRQVSINLPPGEPVGMLLSSLRIEPATLPLDAASTTRIPASQIQERMFLR